MKRIFLTLLSLTVSMMVYSQGRLTPVNFSDLPSWSSQNFAQSLLAFRRSCTALSKVKEVSVRRSELASLGQSWQAVCQKAFKTKASTAKAFFTDYFQPYRLSDEGGDDGLLTGYYLPAIQASLKKTQYFTVPIYARPRDLVTARLGWFKPELKNQKIAARIKDQRLYPYDMPREKINAGGLKDKARVIAYVHSRADRFFLQVQGSGILSLSSQRRLVLGYDGENGSPYFAIGKWFIEKNIIPRDQMSMQAIMAWLKTHPNQADAVLNMNPSFIFFKVLNGRFVYGTDHIPLTPGYSLAVDASYIPLGLPVYVANSDIHRLMVAQDTGGAIRGPLRGDVYWGAGRQAEKMAGHMKGRAAFYLLLPR